MPKLAAIRKALTTRQAYHGSPHDFDKFSTQQIGTGEGAQAYGHGMYFSDSKDIAKHYRDSLSDPGEFGRIDGEHIHDVYKRLEDQAARLPVGPELDVTHERMAFIEDLSLTRDFDESIARIDDAEVAQWSQKEVRPKYEAPGKIYTVEIPDESYMLDWDMPLSEQPESVREALDALLDSDRFKDNSAAQAIRKYNMRGEQIYDRLLGQIGGVEPAEASAYLNSLGVPSISYEGRTSGERNFVVFDDQEVAITNKMATAPVALAVNDFVQRRAEQGSSIALDALEAAATIGSSVAGDFLSNASQLGGYLNPFTDAAEVRAAGERLAERVQYMPSPDNQVLKPVAEWLRGASDAIEPYMPDQQSIDESIPGQIYNALPERAQGVVRSASNLFL